MRKLGISFREMFVRFHSQNLSNSFLVLQMKICWDLTRSSALLQTAQVISSLARTRLHLLTSQLGAGTEAIQEKWKGCNMMVRYFRDMFSSWSLFQGFVVSSVFGNRFPCPCVATGGYFAIDPTRKTPQVTGNYYSTKKSAHLGGY